MGKATAKKATLPMLRTDSPSVPHCGLSFTPVRNASKDLMESLKHQCDCAPISMGEYVSCSWSNPRCANVKRAVEESECLLAQHDAHEIASYNSTATGIDMMEMEKEGSDLQEGDATGSVWGSMFTLTNTILGSGTLAVPYAIASSGWLLGNIVMLTIACITRYSVFLLLSASDRAGTKCAKTYESIGHYTMGIAGTVLAEFTFIFGGFGTLVSYLIFITDLLSAVMGIGAQDKWILTLVCTVAIVFPLSLYRQLGKLLLANILAVLAIAYVVVLVWISFWTVAHGVPSSAADVVAVRLEPGSVYTVTLLIGAFACHNTALPVYDELRDRSIPRMDKAVLGAIGSAFVFYELIGLFGYLQFGSATQDNILLNFSSAYAFQHPAIQGPLVVGQVAMGVALLLTTPVAIWPFRSCILSVYLRVKNNGVQTPSSAATRREFSVVTAISLSLILFCSIFVPSVKIPLSIVGSVSGSLLIFIMPSLFYLLLSPHPLLHREHIGPLIMFGAGVIVGVMGLSLTLYKIYLEHLQ